MLNNFFGKSVFSEETPKNCSWGAHFGEPMCNNFCPNLYNKKYAEIVENFGKIFRIIF